MSLTQSRLFCGVTRRLISLSLPPMAAESLPMIEVDGARIVYRRIGKGRPLVVLNGFGATSADWDPSFIDRLASSNELILLNNRGIGGSTDDGQPFDIATLATDAAHVIETLGIECVSVMGWSMGGFIAQALALNYADRVNKLVLLSTDSGGIEADLASPDPWSLADQNTDVIDAHRAECMSLCGSRNFVDLDNHAAS
jgi:pimeloyl-ACP methyl ester carboxylesterase